MRGFPASRCCGVSLRRSRRHWRTRTPFHVGALLITALSVPMLREHVGWQQWIAVFVGLVGVIIVLKPSGNALVTVGGLAALASAIGYSLNAITIRILTRTDTSAATVFWSLCFLTIIGGLAAIPSWVPVPWNYWPMIAGLGITGALGQYFITEAFRLAPPPVVAPLEYTALAWGMLFDWLIWATAPGLRMLTGAFVIVASGVYVIHRDGYQRRAPAATLSRARAACRRRCSVPAQSLRLRTEAESEVLQRI